MQILRKIKGQIHAQRSTTPFGRGDDEFVNPERSEWIDKFVRGSRERVKCSDALNDKMGL